MPKRKVIVGVEIHDDKVSSIEDLERDILHQCYGTFRLDFLRPQSILVPKSFSRQEETFWALKDINFEVYPGEVVGILGRNGAGKTTLLKILSRITHPTEGEIILRGRVASPLEVGTGFHPELTGRENIHFNGVILGMTKQEIMDKFDEIVAFSGVEKLDTPVEV